jgi:hypothetical protein
MVDTGGIAKNQETTRKTYARWHDNIKMDFRENVKKFLSSLAAYGF